MTLLPLCVVAVALLPQLCGAAGGRQPAAAVVSVPRLPMEAHGFNALDTWPQLLLKFILGHPAVTCAIPATANPAHMADNARAGAGPLPDEAMRARIAAAFGS